MTRSHATEAYADLRSLLLAGEYAPGARLAEVALADRLGMSRTPVREALRRLQADGLVEASWRGVVVPGPGTDEMGESYELRSALEALAARGAARRVDAGEVPPVALAALRRHAEAAEVALEDGDLGATVQHNRDFHEAIAAMAGNRQTARVLSGLWDRLMVTTAASLVPAPRGREVAVEHERLIDAIEAGRADAAAEAAEQHVLATLATIEA